MLDIALIREKPDWVKEQINKLNDEAALNRIDHIVDLDSRRRETRTRIETAQAARNKLNRAMGKLRGNKKHVRRRKSCASKSCLRVAIGRFRVLTSASSLMDGTAPVVMAEDLNAKYVLRRAESRATTDG